MFFSKEILNFGEDEVLKKNIVNSITGNYNSSYTCSTYESAKIIAENIFETLSHKHKVLP